MHDRIETRLYKRDGFNNIVLYAPEEEKPGSKVNPHLYGLGVDISPGGIGLTFDRYFEKGHILKLYLDVEAVECTSPILAEVKWTSDIGGFCRAGLAFLQ